MSHTNAGGDAKKGLFGGSLWLALVQISGGNFVEGDVL